MGLLTNIKLGLLLKVKTKLIHVIDYTKTSSHVIKNDSIRVLFAIVAVIRMHMHQLDIRTTYLNNDVTTYIYMHQPEGFIDPKNPSYVYLLLKSLYGLKQSWL